MIRHYDYLWYGQKNNTGKEKEIVSTKWLSIVEGINVWGYIYLILWWRLFWGKKKIISLFSIRLNWLTFYKCTRSFIHKHLQKRLPMFSYNFYFILVFFEDIYYENTYWVLDLFDLKQNDLKRWYLHQIRHL